MSVMSFDIICCIGGRPAAEIASLHAWAQANINTAKARRVLLIDSIDTQRQGIGERVRDTLSGILSLDINCITLDNFSQHRPGIGELQHIYKPTMCH